MLEEEDRSTQSIAICSPRSVTKEQKAEAVCRSLSISPPQPSPDLPGLRAAVQPGEKDAPVQPGEKNPTGPSWVTQGVTWTGEKNTLSIIDLLRVIVFAEAPRLPEGCFGREIEQFVDGCLQKDRKTRLTTQELLVSAEHRSLMGDLTESDFHRDTHGCVSSERRLSVFSLGRAVFESSPVHVVYLSAPSSCRTSVTTDSIPHILSISLAASRGLA